MLSLALALLVAQTQPAIRRSTPASDDPGMVVRQAGTVNVTCTNCSGGSSDGGAVSQGPGQDGGAWNITNAPSAPLFVVILDGGTGGGGSGGAVTQGTVPWLVAGADGGSVTVDGTVAVSAISGTTAVNTSQVGGNAVTTGSGSSTAGTQRVILATDQTTVPINDNGGSITVDGTVSISGTVAATQSGTWTVRNQDGAGNALASSTTTPAGTEQALVVRNIPSGTQAVSGTVTANAGTGTFSTNVAQYNGSTVGAANAVHVQPGTGASFTVAQSTAANLRTQTASEGSTGAAVPATAGAQGFSDGTNLRVPLVYDTDTNTGTEWTAGATLRVPVFGGSQPVSYATNGGGSIALAVYPLSKYTTTVTTTAVSCGTTATLAPTTVASNRYTATFYNASTVTIYLGGSGVTTANGLPLLPGASFTDNIENAVYYCRVTSGTGELRVLEN